MSIQYLGQAKIFSLRHKEKEWKISVYTKEDENSVVFDNGKQQMTLPVDVLVQTLEGIHQTDPLLIDVVLSGNNVSISANTPVVEAQEVESFGSSEAQELPISPADSSPVTDDEIKMISGKLESTPPSENIDDVKDVPLKRPSIKINPERSIKRRE